MPFYKLTVNQGPVLAEFHAQGDGPAADHADGLISAHKKDEGPGAEYQLYRQAIDTDAWDLFWSTKPLQINQSTEADD